MRRPPTIAKRDGNEAIIFECLRKHGLSVEPISVPGDALVGYGGRTWLVEVKEPKGTLTPRQTAFYDTWRGNKTILRSIEDATEFAREVRGG